MTDLSTRRAELRVDLAAYTIFNFPEDAQGTEYMEIDEDERSYGFCQSLIEFAGRVCYRSFHKPNPKTEKNADYIKNVLTQRHFSVIEHINFTFYIYGVSRSWSTEMLTHRHFSKSQESQRYVPADDLRYVVPPALRDQFQNEDDQAVGDRNWMSVILSYKALLKTLTMSGGKGKKAREAARSILPNMAETRIVLTGNARTWMEFLIKRDNPAADAEMQEVAQEIGRQLAIYAPAIFGEEARALWDSDWANREANYSE